MSIEPVGWLAAFALATMCMVPRPSFAAPPEVETSSQLQPPEPIDPLPPPYPADSGEAVVEVVVRVDVSAEGSPLAVELVSVEPDDAGEAFVTAALDHARSLRYRPGRLDGAQVRQQFDLPIVFDPQPTPAVPSVQPAANAPAPAEPPPAELQPEPEPEVREVRVATDPKPRREAVTGGDFDIDPGRLSAVPRTSAEQMLTLAPGFFLVNEGGEGHPAGFYLRGFDAGVGQDIEFLVDGVPLNEVSNAHNHGFADTLFVIPEVVERLRVTEGPFDARQGDFAVAGSVDYQLGMPTRGVVVKGQYGSFNTGRALVMWGPERFGSGTFVAVDVKGGDGFGINRSHRAARAIARFEHRLPKGVNLELLATGYATRFDQAGVIREDDFEARRVPGCDGSRDGQFFCTYDDDQGGAMSRFLGMARVSHRREGQSFEQSLWVIRRTMRMRANFTGYITDIRTDGGPQRGDGVEQRYDVVSTGGRGSYGLRKDWRGREQSVEVGYGIRFDGGDSIQRRLRTADAVPYTVDFDNRLRVFDISLYGASTLRPIERLDINLGLRVDTFAFSVLDRNRPAMDRDGERETSQAADAYGIAVQPRVSTVVNLARWPRSGGAWDDPDRRPSPGFGSLDWLTAYGVGTRSSDATALSDGEFAPFARVQSAETGLRWRWDGIADLFGFESRAILFYTHVDRDLVFDETQGRNVVVGESNRFGALGVLRAQVDEWLDAQASVTWSEAHLPPESAGAFEWTAGPRLPYVPRVVVRGDVALFHEFWIRDQPFEWTVGLGLSHVAPRPLPLDAFGSRYTVADAAARLRWRYVELGVDIQNLFNTRYRQFELYYASNFEAGATRPSMLPAVHFVAGPPLTAMGTLTLYFEHGERARHRERVRARRFEQQERNR